MALWEAEKVAAAHYESVSVCLESWPNPAYMTTSMGFAFCTMKSACRTGQKCGQIAGCDGRLRLRYVSRQAASVKFEDATIPALLPRSHRPEELVGGPSRIQVQKSR